MLVSGMGELVVRQCSIRHMPITGPPVDFA